MPSPTSEPGLPGSDAIPPHLSRGSPGVMPSPTSEPGLPGWPENTVSSSVQFWYPASSPAQPRGSFYHPNWTGSRACSLAQMQSTVSLPRHPGQPEQTAYTLPRPSVEPHLQHRVDVGLWPCLFVEQSLGPHLDRKLGWQPCPVVEHSL